MNRLKVLSIIILLMMVANLMAQIDADRPDHTESAYTVPQGALQIESGIQIGVEESDDISIRHMLLPSTLFRYGVVKGMELRLEHNFETIKSGDQKSEGFSDLKIGTKINLLSSEKTAIAFLTHVVIPTGSMGFTNDTWGTSSIIAVAHDLTEHMELGYNIGYDYMGYGSGDLTYSLVLGIDLNDKVGIYVEPYGEINDLKEHFANANAGVMYLVNNNLQLDLSFGTGINYNMNYMAVGFSWLIEKKK